MKNLTLILGAMIFINFGTRAQALGDVVFGLKAGANYANQHFGSFGNRLGWKVGYYAGGFVRVIPWKRFALKSELIFAKQGAIFDRQNITLIDQNGATSVGNVRIYINELTFIVPLLVQTNVNDRLYFEVGPQFGIIADTKENFKVNSLSENFIPVQTSDKFDMGLAFGAGYTLSNKWRIEARYFLGLVERDDFIRSSVINLGWEYKI